MKIYLLIILLCIPIVSGYNLTHIETNSEKIFLTFDEKLQPLNGIPKVVMNVYGNTEEFECFLGGGDFSNQMQITQTSEGWQYSLDRRNYPKLCFVDVFAYPSKERFWISAYDGVCDVEDNAYIEGSDCKDIKGNLSIENAWWSNNPGMYVIAIDGNYPKNLSIYVTIPFYKTNSVWVNDIGPISGPFFEILSARYEKHCNETILIMLADNQAVIASKKLTLGCLDKTPPKCGDLICEDIEENFCNTDCTEDYGNKFYARNEYNKIEVILNTFQPDKSQCMMVMEGDNFNKSQNLDSYYIPNTPDFEYVKFFQMTNAKSGNYSAYIRCLEGSSQKIHVQYCGGCMVQGSCIDDGSNTETEYCEYGELLSKSDNGEGCHTKDTCLSNYCSEKNVCLPKNVISRNWYRLIHLF